MFNFFRRKPRPLSDLEWFESQRHGQPRIGKFGPTGNWYAEVVLCNNRITGNGVTLLAAVADCRRRHQAAMDKW